MSSHISLVLPDPLRQFSLWDTFGHYFSLPDPGSMPRVKKVTISTSLRTQPWPCLRSISWAWVIWLLHLFVLLYIYIYIYITYALYSLCIVYCWIHCFWWLHTNLPNLGFGKERIHSPHVFSYLGHSLNRSNPRIWVSVESVQEGDCVSTIRLEDGQEIEVHIRCRFKQGKREWESKSGPNGFWYDGKGLVI